MIILVRENEISSEQLVIYGLPILVSTRCVEFPTQAKVQCEIMPKPPVILAVNRVQAIVYVSIADSLADAQIVRKAKHKVRESRTKGRASVAGILSIEIEKTCQTFVAWIKEIVPETVKLEAHVKFMIAVRLYNRVSDLNHRVGECVKRWQRITQVSDSTKQALN